MAKTKSAFPELQKLGFDVYKEWLELYANVPFDVKARMLTALIVGAESPIDAEQGDVRKPGGQK